MNSEKYWKDCPCMCVCVYYPNQFGLSRQFDSGSVCVCVHHAPLSVKKSKSAYDWMDSIEWYLGENCIHTCMCVLSYLTKIQQSTTI